MPWAPGAHLVWKHMPCIPGKVCCVLSLTSLLSCSCLPRKPISWMFHFLDSSFRFLFSFCLTMSLFSSTFSEMFSAFLSNFRAELLISGITMLHSLVSSCPFSASCSSWMQCCEIECCEIAEAGWFSDTKVGVSHDSTSFSVSSPRV